VNVELLEELLAMAEADQSFRRRWRSLSPTEVGTEMEKEHARAARVSELISEFGWLGWSLVGGEGANAAWLLVQHADHDVELQERCLELLRQAVADGEASSQHLALLTDRVCVNRGRSQIYGTQFTGQGDTFAPRPIQGPKRLDERRASVGLEPFADYRARMQEFDKRS
jgi:hypothetical protein